MNRQPTRAPSSVAPDADHASTLLLSMLPGLGPRILSLLLERFGSPQSVLSATAVELGSVRGVGPRLIHAIHHASDHVDVDSILRWCEKNHAHIIHRGSAAYPNLLEQLDDAPPLLFLRGAMRQRDQISVAVVGTRHATSYGLKQAHRFSLALAEAGVTVVSGLARGIDAAAHRGALDAGGRTIAVLGSGLGQLYPREHRNLADSIAKHGAVISEYSPDARPHRGMFPQRNRLISGLSLATFVVEAPERSGALITTRLAGEQNRDVLALPGPITSRSSRGCNQLIRDGAKLVQTVDDILEELGPLHEPVRIDQTHQIRSGRELNLDQTQRQVLDAIAPTGSLIDQVIQTSGLAAQEVIAAISVLEMRKLVRRSGGQNVVRV